MMSRRTGRAIDLREHIAQSIADIVMTPLGSRVMRRDYGCLLPYLIDQPDNSATEIRVISAIASALMRWEPRIRVTRIALQRDAERPGFAELQLKGSYTAQPLARPLPLSLTVPIGGAS